MSNAGLTLQSPEDIANAALAQIGYKRRIGSLYDGSEAFECLNTDIALESCKCNPSVLVFFILLNSYTLRWRVHVAKPVPLRLGTRP